MRDGYGQNENTIVPATKNRECNGIFIYSMSSRRFTADCISS